MRFPVLSVITWMPFVGALLIMFTARRNPLAVRLIATATTAVSVVLSLWLYVAYDRDAALEGTGFQFYEKISLVPPLGINYELAIDGISLLMVLLTSVIIFAGVFASWTVATRSQEFYALLLALVTGVYGVFVSLDLFVLFLFYEIAVLPMYLLIGIWGSSGEVRPQGVFGWAFGRTGVGTKEYAAMKLTLYLLFGSAFILVGILALYVAGDSSSFSFLEMDGYHVLEDAVGMPRLSQESSLFVRGTLWKRLATGRGFSRQEVVYVSYFALSLLSVVGFVGQVRSTKVLISAASPSRSFLA